MEEEKEWKRYERQQEGGLSRLRRRKGLQGAEDMTIKVKFLAYFRDLFGEREKEVLLLDGSRLRDLLKALCDTAEREKQIFAEEEKLNPHTVIMKNGMPVQSLGGPAAQLADGDIIAIFPYLGGG
jgi:MoaD family protein